MNQRLQQLNNRYERLIELNETNNYTSMVLTSNGLQPNPNAERYLNLILAIKKQKTTIWIANRKNCLKTSQNIETAKNAVINLLKIR